MHRLFSSFTRTSREFDNFDFVKIISQFDLVYSSLNDDDAFESRHFLEFLENILDELLHDSMNDSFSDDDFSSLSSLSLCANANFNSNRWDEYLRIDNERNQCLDLIVFIRWFLWQLCRLLHCRRFQRERKCNECKFLDHTVRFFELKFAVNINRIVSWSTE
jgi:hypothetical protein